jgi:hypothetical protein
MSRKLLQCVDCEASFEVKHDLEERYYKISFCPFCATELDEELQDNLYEDDVDGWES